MLFRGSVESGEPKLEYYEDPKDVGTLKPKGVFLLGSAGIKVGYGVGQGGGDTPSETSNTVRLTLPGRTVEITAPNRIQCRAWMQVISQICNEGGFLQQRKRVGVLFVADLGKAKGSQKKLLSTKYEPKWGVLDCAFLKIFDADSDVGSEKSLKLKIPISASTKIVAPGDDGDEVDPTNAVSARFEVIAGGKVYNLQGNSFRETTEWIADIASVQKERAAFEYGNERNVATISKVEGKKIGIKLKGNLLNGGPIIWDVTEGTLAYGKIQPMSEILEINGTNLVGADVKKVSEIIKSSATLNFVFAPELAPQSAIGTSIKKKKKSTKKGRANAEAAEAVSDAAAEANAAAAREMQEATDARAAESVVAAAALSRDGGSTKSPASKLMASNYNLLFVFSNKESAREH